MWTTLNWWAPCRMPQSVNPMVNIQFIRKPIVSCQCPCPQPVKVPTRQDGCYASSAANLPYPSSSELPLPNSSLPPLPPGVINTEQWGRSIINFGKYKGKNISYIELLSSTSEDMRGYVKWCSSRQSTAGGELKDLTSFMRRHEMENSHSALVRGEMIPGTSARRSFKSP